MKTPKTNTVKKVQDGFPPLEQPEFPSLKNGQAEVQLRSEDRLRALLTSLKDAYGCIQQMDPMPSGWLTSTRIVDTTLGTKRRPGLKSWLLQLKPKFDSRVMAAVILGFYSALPESEHGEWAVKHGPKAKGKSKSKQAK